MVLKAVQIQNQEAFKYILPRGTYIVFYWAQEKSINTLSTENVGRVVATKIV